MGETTSASTPLASIASSRASAEKKASEALNCMRSVSSSRTRSSSQGPTRGPRWSSLFPTASSAPGITCACMSSNTLRLLALGLNLKGCRLGAHAAAAVPHALDRVAAGLPGHRGELEPPAGHGPAGELGHPLDDVLLLD